MDYHQAIDQLLSLVDHERSITLGPRQKAVYDLSRVQALLHRMGDPHLNSPTVHVAGTKGKGSTAALCDAALHAAGYRTGFYSSPHLHSFRERVRLNGDPIEEPEFSALVEKLWPHHLWVSESTGLGAVTLFEFMTAMGFCFFADQAVDFQVIEVGLGGRLDATNVVKPEVCVITPISRDHMAILGDTLAEIALEKAGIIKEGVPVVISPQPPEAREAIAEVCREKGAPPVFVGEDVTWTAGAADTWGQEFSVRSKLGEYQLRTPLLGAHQLANAATALAALEALQTRGHHLPAEAIAEGFAKVSWPCRMEVLSRDPLVVADGAHNDYSVGVLLESLPKYFDYQRLVLIVGFSRDKQVAEMVDILARVDATLIATGSRHPRSLSPEQILAHFRNRNVEAVATSSSREALAIASDQVGPNDLVLVTGSLFVAAEAREALLGIEAEVYPDLIPAHQSQP